MVAVRPSSPVMILSTGGAAPSSSGMILPKGPMYERDIELS